MRGETAGDDRTEPKTESCSRPPSGYGDAHIYLALHLLVKEGRMSRKRLSAELGLGEGSVRSMISEMKEWDIAGTKQTGVYATGFGKYAYEHIPMRYADIGSMYGSGKGQGMLVTGAAGAAADMQKKKPDGNNGITVFLMRNGEIVSPGVTDIGKDYPGLESHIRASGMSEGDVFLLVFSESLLSSRLKAASAALEMLRRPKPENIFNNVSAMRDGRRG